MARHRADVVVVGAGAFGSSIAYHLAVAGAGDVALIDQHAPGSQTSPRAAGMTRQVFADPMGQAHGRLQTRSIAKFAAFADETGEPLMVHRSGSVAMATTDEGARWLADEIAAGPGQGIEIYAIDSADLRGIAPYARAEGVRAMWFTPSDVYLEPERLAAGYARAAIRHGAALLEHTAVIGFLQAGGRIAGVHTADGPIEAPAVVLAAGGWLRALGRLAGLSLPAQPVRHQLLITDPLPGVAPEHAICRVREARVYVRPSAGGLMLGGYEDSPLVVPTGDVGPGFSIEALPLDPRVLHGLAARVARIFPDLAGARPRVVRGGVPTMTPDSWPIFGPVADIGGLFVAGGDNVGGFSISPAVGELLAEWIVTGRQPDLLAPFRADRFGPWPHDAELESVTLERWRLHYRPDPLPGTPATR
ncbi:MAG: FAD-binding oxidoreductase [Chloroflexi bacterium]|nr:FAD-binding oxidoreductase [Chloroflexota bacterium]